MLVIHKLLREGHPNVSIGNLTSLAAISISRNMWKTSQKKDDLK